MATKTQKKWIITGILAGGLFGIYKLLSAKNAADQLRYTIQGIKVTYKDLRLLISINLVITNPTTQNLRFKQFVGKLYADSTFLGFVDIPNATLIKAKADSIVYLSTVIPGTKIAELLLKNLFAAKLPSKGLLKGIATVGNIDLPIESEFDFTTPAKKPIAPNPKQDTLTNKKKKLSKNTTKSDFGKWDGKSKPVKAKTNGK